jgi:DNA-binding ferritin-like protein
MKEESKEDRRIYEMVADYLSNADEGAIGEDIVGGFLEISLEEIAVGASVDKKTLVQTIDEEKDEIKGFASKAWESVHKQGVKVYTAVAQFFSNVAEFFKSLGTQIGNSLSSFFEKLSAKAIELQKTAKDNIDQGVTQLKEKGSEFKKGVENIAKEFKNAVNNSASSLTQSTKDGHKEGQTR